MARSDSSISPSKLCLAKTGFLLIKNLSNIKEKWITDNVLIEIVNEKLNLIDDKIEKSCLNRAITYLYKNKIDILSLHVKNNEGIFKYQNEK